MRSDTQYPPLTYICITTGVDDQFYERHHLPPGHQQLHGPGRRFRAGPEEEEHQPPIKNESPNGLSNVRGSVSMARTSDLNSATSQFYINVVDNSGSLDGARYCAFGHVVEGMEV